MNYVEPIKDAAMIGAMTESLKETGEMYYIIFMVGIYSGLRICDILKLKVGDVRERTRFNLREQKTDKGYDHMINPELEKALAEYCKGKSDGDWLFPSPKKKDQPVSRQYVYKVIHDTGERLGLKNLGCHSMRKTLGYYIYMKTKDIALLMRIYNHSAPGITLRYIGVERNTIDEVIMHINYKTA